MMNLRFGKDVDILIGMLRKMMKPISSPEELQVKKELQQLNCQNIVKAVRLQQPHEEVTQYLLKHKLQH